MSDSARNRKEVKKMNGSINRAKVSCLTKEAAELEKFIGKYYEGSNMTHGQWEDRMRLLELAVQITKLQIEADKEDP